MGGLTKRCGCRKREWSRCRHPWHFACQWKGRRYRVSLDAYVGRPLRGKTEAETEVDRLQAAIRSGTYREVTHVEPQTADSYTLDAYAEIFLERYSKARGKVSWRDDSYRLTQVCGFTPAKTDRDDHRGRCRSLPATADAAGEGGQYVQSLPSDVQSDVTLGAAEGLPPANLDRSPH